MEYRAGQSQAAMKQCFCCGRCQQLWLTGEAQGSVANDAGAFVGKIKEGGGALVVRHDGQ